MTVESKGTAGMTNPTIHVRVRRLVPWAPNPLMRASDRLEAMFAGAAVCFAVFALPLSVAAGTATHDSMVERAIRDETSKHAVTAMVVTDATPSYDRTLMSSATVRWTAAGASHTTSMTIRPDAKTGDSLDIWVDAAGEQVPPPKTRADATKEAVSIGVLTWFGLAGGGFAAAGVLHVLLDRRRLADWDREWREICAAGL